jgi:hypothetical protein
MAAPHVNTGLVEIAPVLLGKVSRVRTLLRVPSDQPGWRFKTARVCRAIIKSPQRWPIKRREAHRGRDASAPSHGAHAGAAAKMGDDHAAIR